MIVGDVVARHLAVLGDQRADHQEVGHRLITRTPCCCTSCGKQRHASELQLVLHLHLRDVGVGARRRR